MTLRVRDTNEINSLDLVSMITNSVEAAVSKDKRKLFETKSFENGCLENPENSNVNNSTSIDSQNMDNIALKRPRIPENNTAVANESSPKIDEGEISSKSKSVKLEITPLRESCYDGIKCSKVDAKHLAKFAHPEDEDYRRPSFPENKTALVPCMYGEKCYRRNPEHFLLYNHPPSSVYKVTHERIIEDDVDSETSEPFEYSDSDEYLPDENDDSN